MSKADKLINKLKQKPKDFTYEEAKDYQKIQDSMNIIKGKHQGQELFL